MCAAADTSPSRRERSSRDRERPAGEDTDMTFAAAMDHVAQLFEVIGALVLLGGLLLSVVLAVRSWTRDHDGPAAYQLLRAYFGGVILLGLEILVAADLVRTVAVAPTLLNVAVLGAIVLIRTFLSFSLEIEIEGVAPWRRGSRTGTRRLGGAAVLRRDARRPGEP
jgi:uncharacterized membrane protein